MSISKNEAYQKLFWALFGYPSDEVPSLGDDDYNFNPIHEFKDGGVEIVNDVLGTLAPREQRVLQLRFGLEDGRSRTLEEVGKEFNVTRERIRQIEAKALRRLRHPSRSHRLKAFLASSDEVRVASGRKNLYDILSNKGYLKNLSHYVAMNVPIDKLQEAFKSSEDAIKASCGILKVSYCVSCGAPLPPGWNLCNRRCSKEYKMISVACSQCEQLFKLPKWQVIRHKRNFCSKECQGRYAGLHYSHRKLLTVEEIDLRIASLMARREVLVNRGVLNEGV